MNEALDNRQSVDGFVHISDVLGDVLKEIGRRSELRARLTAERGRQPTDSELLVLAEREGIRL